MDDHPTQPHAVDMYQKIQALLHSPKPAHAALCDLILRMQA